VLISFFDTCLADAEARKIAHGSRESSRCGVGAEWSKIGADGLHQQVIMWSLGCVLVD
jgi:hypothetical protein